MTLKKINPTKTKSWSKLTAHFKEIENKEIKNLLSSRPNPSDFNLSWNDFNIDISKNRIDNETLSLLIDLSKECDLEEEYIGNARNVEKERKRGRNKRRRKKDKDKRKSKNV